MNENTIIANAVNSSKSFIDINIDEFCYNGITLKGLKAHGEANITDKCVETECDFLMKTIGSLLGKFGDSLVESIKASTEHTKAYTKETEARTECENARAEKYRKESEKFDRELKIMDEEWELKKKQYETKESKSKKDTAAL